MAKRLTKKTVAHTSFSLYAGQDFVEVLTKCRVSRIVTSTSLMRGDIETTG
jgi:hypothetical protein